MSLSGITYSKIFCALLLNKAYIGIFKCVSLGNTGSEMSDHFDPNIKI